jgi:hypothetical protein
MQRFSDKHVKKFIDFISKLILYLRWVFMSKNKFFLSWTFGPDIKKIKSLIDIEKLLFRIK